MLILLWHVARVFNTLFLQLLVLQTLVLHSLFLQTLIFLLFTPNSPSLCHYYAIIRYVSGSRQATTYNCRCNLWGVIQLLTACRCMKQIPSFLSRTRALLKISKFCLAITHFLKVGNLKHILEQRIHNRLISSVA